eukprot:22273_3
MKKINNRFTTFFRLFHLPCLLKINSFNNNFSWISFYINHILRKKCLFSKIRYKSFINFNFPFSKFLGMLK